MVSPHDVHMSLTPARHNVTPSKTPKSIKSHQKKSNLCTTSFVCSWKNAKRGASNEPYPCCSSASLDGRSISRPTRTPYNPKDPQAGPPQKKKDSMSSCMGFQLWNFWRALVDRRTLKLKPQIWDPKL